MNWVEDIQFERRKDIGRSSFATEKVRETNAVANFFDVDFVDYSASPEFSLGGGKTDYMKIPTPILSKILDDQGVPPDAQKKVFALIGRIIYETGELDNWQVVLWILGRAGTGKSTLCRLVELFYQADDVAVISNNIEEKFGLENVHDRLIYMAPEIKRDFKLSQAEFQSMVSGEKMSVARKFKTAANVLFTVPGLLAGNDMPAWVDSSHSIIRRIVLLNFVNRLKKVDGEIANKLALEVAAILIKCNEAYHDCVKEVGSDQIWDHLPEYFKNTQNKLKSKTDPLYAFMQSGEIEFDPSYVVTEDDFRTSFNDYVKKINLKPCVWNDELYAIPFQEMKLTQEVADKIVIDQIEMSRIKVIKGCRKTVKTTGIGTQNPPPTQNASPMRNRDGGTHVMQTYQPLPSISLSSK